MENNINLLVSLDQNYIPQLRVMLASCYLNHPGVPFRVFLLHRGFPEETLIKLQKDLEKIGYELCPVLIDTALFADAPVTKQYPQEMYYRLLAAQFLPKDLERILYLDPDVLIIRSILPLWETDLGDYLFAAAAHTGKTEFANQVNRVRLGTQQDYFNSGVLLMNLKKCREEIDAQAVFGFVREHAQELVLPDQDVLNALYGNRILALDDAVWNYDARNYSNYLMRSFGKADMNWVMENTAILHFCGKEKPWKPHYRHRFGVLYLHYMHLADLVFSK